MSKSTISRLRIVAKLFAVAVFIVGAVMLINASAAKRKDNGVASASPFVITYRVTRTEAGKPPAVIGLIVHIDNAKGGVQDTRLLDKGDGSPIRQQTRFDDPIASYEVHDDYLEYVESREGYADGDQHARSYAWASSSPSFVREETILGMKGYLIHQETGSGYIETLYTPLLSRTPLIDREVFDGIETTREAISVQFRPVSDEEVSVPNLPVRFDKAKKLIGLFRAGGNAVNLDTADKFEERMNLTREKLRGLGRRTE